MKIWYAVQKNRESAWDHGSHDLQTAMKMLAEQGNGIIAVIDEDHGVCIDEIEI